MRISADTYARQPDLPTAESNERAKTIESDEQKKEAQNQASRAAAEQASKEARSVGRYLDEKV